METSPSLLERLRQPADHKAWGRFVELYTPLLLSWARGIGMQEADMADLVQDVLTLLFRKLPEFSYDKHKSFRNWLRTVTLNKYRENLRRRVPVTTGGDAALAALADSADLSAFEETEYRRHLVQQALEEMQAEFPASTWKAFREYVMLGRPAEEVAAELGLRVGTVYAAKSRILGRLRRELAGLLD